MADMIRAAARTDEVKLQTIPHGFERWPEADQPSAAPDPPPFRFLVVSHYNYFRNFETVLHALADLRHDYGNGDCKLLLTTKLQPGLRMGGYDTTAAHRLIRELGLSDAVTMLGAVPYDDLPALYRSAHAVICPSYAESFSHTVVESMALGVPVIASDIPTHREVAGEAALFFSPLDAGHLARRCREMIQDESMRARLGAAGRERARVFSWQAHFRALLAAASAAAA
jgi:glycosyltransferase involved in cell wall biosynthesis